MFVKTLSVSAIVTVMVLTAFAVPIPIQGVRAQGPARQSPPAGFPGASALASTGKSFVPLIEQTPRFRSLANGVAYHVEPYSSFGYMWGPSIHSVETITLFAPGDSAYIQAQVDLVTKQIQIMGFVNDTQLGIRYTNGAASLNWGGSGTQWCTGSIFGYCISTGPIYDAIGVVGFPNLISSVFTGESQACCQFAEWTGVTSGTSSQLVQGGIAWSGFNQPTLPYANAKGFSLFTEYVPSSSNGGSGPVFYSTPSWMNWVQGQTINMWTYDVPNGCYPASGDFWYQEWYVGSNNIVEPIQCVSHNSENYAWYIFESPYSPVTCSNGGYDDFCQIPLFSNITGGGVTFVGTFCATNGNCYKVTSDANPWWQYYIEHSQIDTATSAIPSGTGTWQESWVSGQ